MRAVGLLILLLGATACNGRGDRFEGARKLMKDRCGSCHLIPGVAGARGNVGPPLLGIGTRQVIAGHFPNSRSNMIRWITHAQAMLPGNAMPDTGLTPEQAERIADYLYTLDR